MIKVSGERFAVGWEGNVSRPSSDRSIPQNSLTFTRMKENPGESKVTALAAFSMRQAGKRP